MKTAKKFWFVVAGSLLAFVLIACSCSSLIPNLSKGGTSGEAVPGMAGKWLDPDTSGTYHVIVWQNGKYEVTQTINPDRGANEVTESNWDGTTLTWKYCVTDGPCVTTKTVSVSGDNLETTWESENGNSGTTTMTRMNP
jgi:hypothetical protein